MSASAPATAPQRTPAFRYCNFEAENADDLELMSELWLLDVCAAPWVSREAQKLAAYIVTIIGSGKTSDVYLRDLETNMNILPEETARGLRLLKAFRVVDDFLIDKGKLALTIRVSKLQLLKYLDAKDRLAALTSAGLDAAASRNAAELRGIVAISNVAPAAVNDEQSLPAAAVGT